MRTTLNLDEELLSKVAELTGEESKSKAVSKALEEYVRKKKLELLLSLRGKIDLVENWRELRDLELRKRQW